MLSQNINIDSRRISDGVNSIEVHGQNDFFFTDKDTCLL